MVLPVDEGKNKTRQEITLFPKGSPFPQGRMIQYHGQTPLNFQVLYTNKTDIPTGISPKVGHFMVDQSKTSGAGKVMVELRMALNIHGIVVIESASVIKDKRSAPRTFHSYLENLLEGTSHTSNLDFSENLDVATTEDELREAQERENMLFEQDKKVEECKDQRNTLKSFVYDARSKISSAYRNFASDSETKAIIDSLQKTEDWLYEDSDDESEQDYTGKLEVLKNLLDPIENKYKNETAKLQATKALQTCITEYRMFAESLSLSQK